jgi:hypothetical protein
LKYLYNENVMMTLLENNYFAQEFLLKDLTQLYGDLMYYLLTASRRPQIKVSVCKHLIEFASELKKTNQANEAILTAFMPLIQPLLQLYHNVNRTLCTMSCVALYNLCIVSKMYKYEILKDDSSQAFVNRLVTKDVYILRYTLK